MKLESIKMLELLGADKKRIKKIVELKVDYLKGEMDMSQAQQEAKSLGQISGEEFALSEQYMGYYHISDYELTSRLNENLEIFKDIRTYEEPDLVPGHPIHSYLLEVEVIKKVLRLMEDQLKEKYILNPWLEIYDKLVEIKIHFDRKQNQLYPMLEQKGFDKPSRVMWSLEDLVEDHLRKCQSALSVDEEEVFLSLQDQMINLVEKMLEIEVEILYPTALALISQEEFAFMRRGDGEIGYCLIDEPEQFGSSEENYKKMNKEFMRDLADLLGKHGMAGQGELDVSRGKLTLEQINLIFKHMKIDLSYVDENDIVRFYTDTDHRVFPRSPGIIGRHVENCHPKESLGPVVQIVELFRAGVEDEAEFWIDSGDKFIYINFTAVRDEEGNFRGVLEMMQDVTHIRSLEGSNRLASWARRD